MKNIFSKKSVFALGVVSSALLLIAFLTRNQTTVDYSADVKPILNKHCISCHGGVMAKGGFSVLFEEEAFAPTASGKPAIIPGNPGASELIRRLTASDPEERMPYQHAPLSKEEISVLTRWIKQGAKWGEHWAYQTVAETKAPDVTNDWIHNEIDRFVYQKLNEKKLSPSAEADKPTLLRRVSLDLIGMYPDDATAKKYLESSRDAGYEELVDALLGSSRFGEKWAGLWMDLARYADTKGYEADGGRNIWRYRDWLINAFNKDKPYNIFITEQIAGDLLPNPTDEQYIATAFSRNTMTNDEGGTDNEEFRVDAVMDRVNTTWEALMGTTFSCVQCHSHPYDPFRHDEYFKFMAYFNNTRDEDIPADYPLLREFKNDTLKQNFDEVLTWMKNHAPEANSAQFNKFIRTWQPSINLVSADSLNNAIVLGKNVYLVFSNYAQARLRNVNLEGKELMVWNFQSNVPNGVMKLRIGASNGPVIATIPIRPHDKWRREFVEFPVQKGIHDIYLTYENPSKPAKSDDFYVSFDWMAFLPAFPGSGEKGFAHNRDLFHKLIQTNEVNTTPVMDENPDWMWRKTVVFERGNRLLRGKEVTPAVPEALSFPMPEGTPYNRYGLALWLTDHRNPLVSRTIVNRLWEQLFGTGLVETLEDLGTMGMNPTHRELLDHLSWRFMHEMNWSIKTLLKEMVLSAVYRQDSRLTDELLAKDPANKWYARGPRIRLSAEQIRDQALSISGAFSDKMYGPGVMPWQPPGIWLSPYNRADWKNSKGEDQYRRALYTYWKRTAPYPSMITFDAVPRVLCSARRIRTNTPLQALVTLNDSAYLDLARHFAWRMKKEGGESLEGQLKLGYQIATFKELQPNKLKVFEELFQQAQREFRSDSLKARQMLGGPDKPADSDAAALVVVANAMINLDELLTKN